MNFIKNNLANAFTLGNLFSGSIGIINLITGNYKIAVVCVIISLIFDFFDGFVARAVKSNSELGVQLDSLADMVSFGLLPGVVMYKALEPFGNQLLGMELPFNISYLGLFITLFSCLRLAIFNLDDEQTYYFKGLNTPSNTMLIFGLYFAFLETGSFKILFESAPLLLAITFISSFLLVSPVKMISMKFKSMKIADNYSKVALFVGVIFLLIFFKFAGIPLAILYYILISIFFQKQLK